MYIRKLVFRGENLEDAVLDFYPGFNSITGASDSGKSLVVSLIQFALGTEFPVEKLPEEAKGYDNVFLEIVASGKTYTLFRKITSSESILVYELPYEQITEQNVSSYHEYSLAPNAKEANNFSRFMLKIIECPYKNLVREDGKMKDSHLQNGYDWSRLMKEESTRIDRSFIALPAKMIIAIMGLAQRFTPLFEDKTTNRLRRSKTLRYQRRNSKDNLINWQKLSKT